MAAPHPFLPTTVMPVDAVYARGPSSYLRWCCCDGVAGPVCGLVVAVQAEQVPVEEHVRACGGGAIAIRTTRYQQQQPALCVCV